MAGRPSKLDNDLINEICEWVSSDVPLRFCADGVGITYHTLNMWLKKGEEDALADVESIERDLYHRVKKTYAIVVRASLNKIKTGERNWQGEAWIRQRRDNEFMDKQEIVSNDEKVIVQLGSIKGKHLRNDKKE